jgi:hypothetical protein
MQKIQRAVLAVDLPEVAPTAGAILTAPRDVESITLDTPEGVPVLKIVTKGKTAVWYVPIDKVRCFEPLGKVS